MFDMQENLLRLEIPASRIKRLYQAMGLVQLAIPGFPTQGVGAYMVAFSQDQEQGCRVAVALHLKETARLVFYLNEAGDVPADQVEDVLEDGVIFVESMGFLLNDLEFHVLSVEEREKLWNSLPLRQGIIVPSPSVEAENKASGEEKPPLQHIPAHIEERRQRLIENIGRIMGSL